MTEQLLKWFHQFCRLIDGLIGVLTIGFINTSLGLWSAKLLSKYRAKTNPEDK